MNATFEVGKTYRSRYAFEFTVIKRTEKSVFLYDLFHNAQIRRKIKTYDYGGEYVEICADEHMAAIRVVE